MNSCNAGDTQDFVSESQMEPEAEDPDNLDASVYWSGSDGSQACRISESPTEFYGEEEFSDVDTSFDAQTFSFPKSDCEHQELLESQDHKLVCEQRSLPDLSGGEDEDSYHKQDIYPPDPRDIPPHIKTSSPRAQFSKSECHDPDNGQMPRSLSLSPSSSLGYDPETAPARTLTTGDEPPGGSYRQGQGTGSRGVESSEEGGRSEGPPAAVSFGISDEGAEQTEKWNSESDTDLGRRDSRRPRCTRFGQDESQSQRQVKETKSKCKRIARLLTDAPNPQNKGALLFKKRRQRVKKYTFVSYGTGDSKFDSEGQLEEEAEEIREAALDFVATSDSELEEEYSIFRQQRKLSVDWRRVQEMEVLPGTKGKGVLMFAHRRKRMEEVLLQQERYNEGLHLKAQSEPGYAVANNMYEVSKRHDRSDQGKYMDKHIHQINRQRSLVSNRTAKPFLGGQVGLADRSMPAGPLPVRKKPESIFKAAVSVVPNRHVWSPTGDVIASRDERISVPARKTCNLPESRRKSSGKQHQTARQGSDPRESRAYTESEEDCFSLGAEACNFMQPRAIKLKNPPPVAPKPSINPKSPPCSRGPPSEPCIPPSSVSQAKYLGGPQRQQHYLDQDCSQPQKYTKCWEADRAKATIQTPAVARESVSSSSQPHLQPTTNSWNKPLPRSVVSMKAHAPSFSSVHPQSIARCQQASAPSSVPSCPPKPMKSFTSKTSLVPPRGQVFAGGFDRVADDRTMIGKGAELFYRRQSRMEKFIVGDPTENQTRCPSPTMSLPNSWRYSSNIRAPPPLSYNPLHFPFYSPPPVKTGPSTKITATPKPVPKQFTTLEIMKYQPYHLNSSLFHYDAVPQAKSPTAKPAPPSNFEITQKLKQRSGLSHSAYITEPDLESKSEASAKSSAKSSGPGKGRSRSLSLPRRSSSPGPPNPRWGLPLAQRHGASLQRGSYKPPTPWEAASRSPFGSVDDAFSIGSASSRVASRVRAAASRRSLPEPPEEWKRRVSLDMPPASQGCRHTVPVFVTSAPTRANRTTALYGPPFRPAQSLKSADKPRIT